MHVKYDIWTQSMSDWAKDNKFTFKVVKAPSVGFLLDYLIAEINIESEELGEIKISQGSVGTEFDVDLSYIKFENQNEKTINFHLSLYQRDFFDRLFNRNILKTFNREFNKKFGVVTNNKILAQELFADSKVQAFFLGNSFLTFNIEKSLITMKSMNMKIYGKHEIQDLYDMYIHILNLLPR